MQGEHSESHVENVRNAPQEIPPDATSLLLPVKLFVNPSKKVRQIKSEASEPQVRGLVRESETESWSETTSVFTVTRDGVTHPEITPRNLSMVNMRVYW